jgi:hypothetical protein
MGSRVEDAGPVRAGRKASWRAGQERRAAAANHRGPPSGPMFMFGDGIGGIGGIEARVKPASSLRVACA